MELQLENIQELAQICIVAETTACTEPYTVSGVQSAKLNNVPLLSFINIP